MLKHITKSKTICKFSEKIDTSATIYICFIKVLEDRKDLFFHGIAV